MASIQNVVKKILINYLFLVKKIDCNRSEFEKKRSKMALFDIKHEVYCTLNTYDKNWLIFNLGIAFSWFTEECTNDEANASIAALSEIYDIFDIKEPDDEEEEETNNSTILTNDINVSDPKAWKVPKDLDSKVIAVLGGGNEKFC